VGNMVKQQPFNRNHPFLLDGFLI